MLTGGGGWEAVTDALFLASAQRKSYLGYAGLEGRDQGHLKASEIPGGEMGGRGKGERHSKNT